LAANRRSAQSGPHSLLFRGARLEESLLDHIQLEPVESYAQPSLHTKPPALPYSILVGPAADGRTIRFQLAMNSTDSSAPVTPRSAPVTIERRSRYVLEGASTTLVDDLAKAVAAARNNAILGRADFVRRSSSSSVGAD